MVSLLTHCKPRRPQELYNATFKIHKSLIRFLTNLTDDTIIDEEKENLINAKKCLVGTLEDISLADTIIRESYAKTLNNRKRLFDYFANSEKISGNQEINFDEEKFEEYKALCQ